MKYRIVKHTDTTMFGSSVHYIIERRKWFSWIGCCFVHTEMYINETTEMVEGWYYTYDAGDFHKLRPPTQFNKLEDAYNALNNLQKHFECQNKRVEVVKML